jgi:hypothetical protein
MKCEDRTLGRDAPRVTWAALSALLLSLAAMTACGSEDQPLGEPVQDASSDARVVVDAKADAGGADVSADGHIDAAPATDGDADARAVDAHMADGGADRQSSDGGGDARPTSPDGGAAADVDAGETFSGRVLVAKTNFTTVTEVATIDLANRYVVSSAGFQDGDSIPIVSNGRAFVLERTLDLVRALDGDGVPTKTIPLGQDGGPRQNPHDVVLIPGTSTAFVPLYNTGRVAVVDVDAETVLSTIDLSGFADASDGDHSPDIDSAIYVPATGLVYFTLQRIDTTGFPIACPPVPSLIVAVDPATRQVVAIDAGTPTIELTFVSPSSMEYDAQGGRLLVLSNGCEAPTADGGTMRLHHGIEAVTLATGQKQVLYAPTSPDYLSSLILLGPGAALVNSFDANFAGHWNRWDVASPVLGAALANVPSGAIRETADTLLGVRDAFDADGGAAGYDVVRYRVATDQSSLAVSNPFASPYPFINGLALVP